MMTDPIADMLTRIRNANSIHRGRVSMPASQMKVGIAEVLKQEGFIRSYEVEEASPQSSLHIDLKYGPDGERVLRNIERVSKPGCRVYRSPKDLPPVLQGLGVYLLSTSKGILSDRGARTENVGGEVLARIF